MEDFWVLLHVDTKCDVALTFKYFKLTYKLYHFTYTAAVLQYFNYKSSIELKNLISLYSTKQSSTKKKLLPVIKDSIKKKMFCLQLKKTTLPIKRNCKFLQQFFKRLL